MLDTLKRRCIKGEPYIWVRRLIVLERCSPHPVIVRDIRLSRGLNIIWAEEPDEEEVTTPIAGHSAGKTTFCRFFRYVLGETTFANQKNAKLIRSAFENGYVAAEIYVDGRLWAVRRPIGSGRLSYIAPDITIEQLLELGGKSVTQEQYIEQLGMTTLLDKFAASGIARSGEPIQWEHILAWMTRDQEARFQSVYDWRSPRSDSNTPSFRYPRSGALFVMRAALGLFIPEEILGEEKLTKLYQERDKLEKDVQVKRQEPEYRANYQTAQLRYALRVEFPKDGSIDTLPLYTGDLMPDLLTRATDAIRILGLRCSDLGKQVEETQQTIDAKNGELECARQRLKRLLATMEQASDLNDQTAKGLSAKTQQRKKISDSQDAECEMAWILIRDCKHVQELNSNLSTTTAIRDTHELEQAEARITEYRQRVTDKIHTTQKAITDLEAELKTLGKRRTTLQNLHVEAKQCQDYLDKTRTTLAKWVMEPVSPDDFQELHNAERALTDKQLEIAEQETRLAEFIKGHKGNRDLLADIFSMCVRSVISAPGYDGKVAFADRELDFHLVHGTAMSGEAVETLAILLADVSALLFNCISREANLPGFLLHDSPREADLGLRLYRAFITFIATLESTFGGADNCPFQYILTTTSPPPRELRESPMRKDRFSARTEQDLFLRRNISTVRPPETTQDTFANV